MKEYQRQGQKWPCLFSYSSVRRKYITIESKVLSMAFPLTAEIERDFISARTKAALRA